MKRCYELLNLTSRSFAAVIQALDEELRPAICLFYLVLRGLDTVEDDMSIDNKLKIALLLDFHNKLEEKGWTFDGNGPDEKDRVLMVEFDQVIEEFLNLKPKYQAVIKDITLKMGAGMAEFAAKESVTGTKTKEEYNLYCHYVAGLVGIGLSQLFAASELEDASVGKELDRANSMGLFLQKTNIIRDYLEDLEEGRTWYPEEVWSKHVGKLSDMAEKEHQEKALGCLNELVTDALQHIPDVFAYMANLKNQSVFNFCAIPQVMAIATLAKVYDNPAVFKGAVKIRKGTALQLMLRSTSMDQVYAVFDEHTFIIKNKMRSKEVSLKATKHILCKVDDLMDGARDAGVFTSDRTEAVPVAWIRTPLVVALLGYAVYALSPA